MNIEEQLKQIQKDIEEIKINIAILKQRFVFYNIIIPIFIFVIGFLIGIKVR
ncbi:MAG: hypothetical protein QXF15_03595 [Candidatus Aenigmatarchaeota archaeon]